MSILASTLDHQPWMTDAACREVDPDLFYPEKAGPNNAAKQICDGCDVKAKCLEYALKAPERHGIWAGLNPHKRNAVLKARGLRTMPPTVIS